MDTNFIEASIDELTINPLNDRHGPLPKDKGPIDWMLENKNKEIRNLAIDIVQEKRIYESLLVEEVDDAYLVWDGNRRTTALKLLNNPNLAKDKSTRKYFEGLAKKLKEIPLSICQIENNDDIRDKILDRRHSGTQDGVGQAKWGTHEKHNFKKRKGKKSSLGHAIRDLLIKEDLLKTDEKVHTSSIEKILDSKTRANKVGISYEKEVLIFTHNEKEVLRCLLKIAKDTTSGRLTLNKLLNANQKNGYIKELETDGFLPEEDDKLEIPQEIKEEKSEISDEDKKKIKQFRSPQRKTLIRKENKYDLGNDPKLNRFREIWTELQFKLKLSEHTNAISVLSRVIIEFAVKYYNENNGVQYNERTDSLARKIELAANKMAGKNIITPDRASEIVNFAKSKNFFSPKTLNSYVHSMDHFPDPEALKNLWDNLELFICNCIKQRK